MKTNHQITALVVDDDQRSREVLSLHLRAIPGIEVIGAARDADEALHMLLGKVPDILFLDVEMPGKTGFDLVTNLTQLNIQTCIVFQTAFNHYALQAIKSAAFDYLMKPIDPEELREVVAKYRAGKPQSRLACRIDDLLSHLNAHKKIRFNTRTGFIMIDPAEIVYCQADWNYTEIFLSSGTKHVVSMNIGKVEEQLNPNLFFRLNRSVIICRDTVESADRKKRECVIGFDGEQKRFKIPTGQIRALDHWLGE